MRNVSLTYLLGLPLVALVLVLADSVSLRDLVADRVGAAVASRQAYTMYRDVEGYSLVAIREDCPDGIVRMRKFGSVPSWLVK